MKKLDMVYCVSCNSIVTRDDASVIFRTGFYKVSIPLACCVNCTDNAKKEAFHPEEYMGNYVQEIVAYG